MDKVVLTEEFHFDAKGGCTRVLKGPQGETLEVTHNYPVFRFDPRILNVLRERWVTDKEFELWKKTRGTSPKLLSQ